MQFGSTGLLLALFVGVGCSAEGDAATGESGFAGSGGSAANTGGTAADEDDPDPIDSDPAAEEADGGSGSDTVANDGEPGTVDSTLHDLAGEVTACEMRWTVRMTAYHPRAVVPRRMYSAACDTDSGSPTMFTSLSVGEVAFPPDPEPTAQGLVVRSVYDPNNGRLVGAEQQLFPECESMHGIATSADCGLVAALCRTPVGREDWDVNALATVPDSDWIDNPHYCGDKLNDQMWLYEWDGGDITAPPRKYVVHGSIGSWEYGNDYLRYDEVGDTYGIAVKAATGGGEQGQGCHEADSFLVLDRQSESMDPSRGWTWACGTGHTIFNRLANQRDSSSYAMACTTDWTTQEIPGVSASFLRLEQGPATEFTLTQRVGIQQKGGVSAFVPAPDGGWIALVVGVAGEFEPAEDPMPLDPPSSIGWVRWNASGEQLGDIRWILSDPTRYLSYASLTELAPDKYLLGWGEMLELPASDHPARGEALRVPWTYHLREIDGDGNFLTDSIELEGAGWGEVDEMVSLGEGTVGWAYIDDPALRGEFEIPNCNQPNLKLSVYRASE